jgi:hypothetical protein
MIYEWACLFNIELTINDFVHWLSQIGDYERTRIHDEQNTLKLRDRINQLDLENTALAAVAQSLPSSLGHGKELELPQVMDDLVQLLAALRECCQHRERSAEGQLALVELLVTTVINSFDIMYIIIRNINNISVFHFSVNIM